MKKLVGLAVIGLVAVGLSGCGPKKATRETLSQIEECKKAEESANQKLQQLQAQIDQLKGNNLDQQITTLQQKRDSLKAYLDLLEKGY